MGVCNIIFTKNRTYLPKSQSKTYGSGREGRKASVSNYQGEYNTLGNRKESIEMLTGDEMKNTKYSTLRNTRPRFAYPSFNFNPQKDRNEAEIKELMSHFSVSCNGTK